MTNALTLYNVEENLAAFLETEAMVPEEQLAEFAVELVAAGQAALDKRDGVIRFHQHVEAQIEHARAEEKRIAEWRKSLEGRLERFEGYVARVIEENMPEPKKGVRKLEGRVGEIRLVKKPGSVVITDEAAIPESVCGAVVTFKSAEHWRDMMENLAKLGYTAPAPDGMWSEKLTPSLSAIKKAIEAGEDVPGADLTVNQFRLEIK